MSQSMGTVPRLDEEMEKPGRPRQKHFRLLQHHERWLLALPYITSSPDGRRTRASRQRLGDGEKAQVYIISPSLTNDESQG